MASADRRISKKKERIKKLECAFLKQSNHDLTACREEKKEQPAISVADQKGPEDTVEPVEYVCSKPEEHLIEDNDIHEKYEQEIYKSNEESIGYIKETKMMPRGMRIFHAEMNTQRFETIRKAEALKGTHKATLNDIFDPQAFSGVSFEDFSSLWQHINGSKSIISSKGSSHRRLLDANGKTVAGTYAHNPGMTYGKQTIRYIRDALERIGFGEAVVNDTKGDL